MKKKINFHFSVDDVFESLIEISDSKIKLIDHWFFSQLYFLWKKFNIKSAVYLFYEGKILNKKRSLKEVRNLKRELNGNWLYFGPHALNHYSPPHKYKTKVQKEHFQKIYSEINRFAGQKYMAKKIRLHEYSESYELVNFFKKYNVNTLFTTDKNVGSHRMPLHKRSELINIGNTNYKNMHFIRTDFRVENLKNDINHNQIIFNQFFKNRKFITIYSHEYEMKKSKIKKLLVNNISLIAKKFNLVSKKP